MTEEAAVKGLPFINYPHLHRQVWAKEHFRTEARGEFSLPCFEFVYDRHWDLGHAWAGDMK